ncbi:MAG: cellulase family glycosylhydrolase [Chloroflexi bacterium]|nr:cellulase family glycosylhydrolase [Chloroflexota bacterium]
MRRWLLLVQVLTVGLLAGVLAMVAGAPSAQAVSGFVTIHDANHLGLNGGVWYAKAVHFWMTDYVTGPPAGWYNTWVLPQDSRYLAQARWQIRDLAQANLGANTLRVFFDFAHVTDRSGNFLPDSADPTKTTLDHLDTIMALAAEQGMKVTIVLFGPSSCGEVTGCWSPAQEQFVVAMARHLRNNPTLAYWGTVNEINDQEWGTTFTRNPANRDLRLNWNWHIAATLRAYDPNHLISTSIQTDAGDGTASRYRDYFLPVSWNPAGTLASMVDFLTPHSYLGVTAPNQEMIRNLRAGAPGKPIVLEEVGWPSGWSTDNPQFTAEVQTAAISAILSAARSEGIAGVGIWMLADFNGLPDAGSPEQSFFGLFWSTYTAQRVAELGQQPAPQPWSRKPAADVVQRHFRGLGPE